MASAESPLVSALRQGREHLKGDFAGPLHHVPPPVSQRWHAPEHVAVVAVQVPESAGTFVTPAAIQLHQESELVIVDIGSVGQVRLPALADSFGRS